jgi:protein TonB
MRSRFGILSIAIACGLVLGACETTKVVHLDTRVCPSSATVAPGGYQTFELCDHPIPDSLVQWSVTGPGRIREGRYDAPVIVSAPTSVTIHARGPRDVRTLPEGQATVFLEAGSVPGADSCAGPLQGGLPDDGAYVELDELPEAITRVAPSYPDSAREHGVEGTVTLQALLCAGGNVIDTDVVQSIPELDGAARDAVLQWVFIPGKKNGVPYAVWVVIPIRFSLPGPAVVVEALRPLAVR